MRTVCGCLALEDGGKGRNPKKGYIMDKREFKKYCDGIAALEVGGAQWDSVDAETVGEYIGARIDGGAGLVLAKLAAYGR